MLCARWATLLVPLWLACGSGDISSGTDASFDAIPGDDAIPGVDAAPPADAYEPGDIYDELVAIDGMVSVAEGTSAHAGYRAFTLIYEQPSDHDNPGGQKFGQRLFLLHRAYDAPMVLGTNGYALRTWMLDSQDETTSLLHGNQVLVEHRFFAQSRPDPADWDHLRIRQAAGDHHRVVQALSHLYPGVWLNAGGSKGGMAATYHRRFYPDDVDGTIARVTPISFGTSDARYLAFFDAVATASCRQSLRDFQRDALENRRAYIEDRARADASSNSWTFDFHGGVEVVVEEAIIWVAWDFWQYGHLGNCDSIPGAGASDAEVYSFLGSVSGVGGWSDASLLPYMPYYFQTEVELGGPALPTSHLSDLLLYEDVPIAGFYPDGSDMTFEPDAMLGVADWVAIEGSRLMFVYGEYDPWGAGDYDLGDAADSYKYTVAQGNHDSYLLNLAGTDLEEALSALEAWTGVTPSRSASSEASPRPRPPRQALRRRSQR